MSKVEVTDGQTPPNEPVTPEGGEVVEGGTTNQDSNERLAKLEADLQAFASQVEQAKKAREAAEAKATAADKARLEAERERDREVKIRIGHQQNAGPKLQKLAELEKQQATQVAFDEKLNRLEGLVTAMAQTSLDAESFAKISRDVDVAQKERELARLRAEVQQRSQPAPAQQAPELTPAWKKQLKDELFSEFDVDPLELTTSEWHQYDSRDEDHWREQVRAEFKKRHDARHQSPAPDPDELKNLILAQVEAQVKTLREEDEKRVTAQRAELAELQKATEEAKRLAEEQLNRAKGMDRGHQAVSEPVVEKTIAKELNKLDPAALYSADPSVREAYVRARENDKGLRDRILDRARQAQAQANR